ncbi:hypothetical protein KF707C_31080 [Metapseudomonas furukawaii]|uniref:Uncharacterized protein n=1 Tax=Metapseudomonas furukawaii TaxID=1149133 RepID=A0AAD1C1E0_METFU|nr:hypothetical protein KF707C_31080 [Pseudomonas furukawaii]
MTKHVRISCYCGGGCAGRREVPAQPRNYSRAGRPLICAVLRTRGA